MAFPVDGNQIVSVETRCRPGPHMCRLTPNQHHPSTVRVGRTLKTDKVIRLWRTPILPT